MYLTYAQYTEMGGTLTEPVFSNYEFMAEAIINNATFNRLAKYAVIPNAVLKLTKYLVDLVEKKTNSINLGQSANSDNTGSTFITSQSNDGVQVSYNGMAPTDVFTLCNTEIQNAIKLYLGCIMNEAGQYLLYRGLYKGE
jgi:hypothetical protein